MLSPKGQAGPQGEKGDTGETGPQGEQGPQGMVGPAGADGVAAGLNCTTDQIIKWGGSAWVCASRLSGAITMIDRWYSVLGESDSTQNIDFTQDSG